jgi:hypothetical protein
MPRYVVMGEREPETIRACISLLSQSRKKTRSLPPSINLRRTRDNLLSFLPKPRLEFRSYESDQLLLFLMRQMLKG